MAEQVEEYNFSNRELIEALIKKQGLHEGIWMLGLRFGLGGANVNHPDDPLQSAPAAIIPVVGFSLRKKDTLNPLALDAAVVNPRPKSRK
jgi:hypothetical protein